MNYSVTLILTVCRPNKVRLTFQLTIGTSIIMSTPVTTLEQATRSLFLTSHVLGLGVHTPGKFYLSIFYNVILWSAYSYLHYYMVIALKVEKIFLVTSTIIINALNYLMSITSVIVSLYQRKVYILTYSLLVD